MRRTMFLSVGIALLMALMILPGFTSYAQTDFVSIYDPVPYVCSTTDTGVTTTTSYEFATAPIVWVDEYLDGTLLGTYDLSFFYDDLMSTDRMLWLNTDFSFTDAEVDYTFLWDIIFYVDGELFGHIQVTRDCLADTASIAGSPLTGDAPAVVVEPVPGCDVTINIPSGAVGATLVTDANVYWEPGEMTAHVLPAGTNVRAIGLDASGAYYKVLYVCDYLWVPANALGPNFDAVWNGAPLPTGVVD